METENNKLIAEFMEYPGDGEGLYFDIESDIILIQANKLPYSTDWNWLMEVVEKIESLTDINSNGCFMELESIGFNAKFIFDDGTRILKDSKGETKIEAVYNACVEFIKWHNNQIK